LKLLIPVNVFFLALKKKQKQKYHRQYNYVCAFVVFRSRYHHCIPIFRYNAYHFESFIIFLVVFKLHRRCNKYSRVPSWSCVLICIRIICTPHAYNIIMWAQSVWYIYVPFNQNICYFKTAERKPPKSPNYASACQGMCNRYDNIICAYIAHGYDWRQNPNSKFVILKLTSYRYIICYRHFSLPVL